MLVVAGMLPHPPLIVPEVAQGAASELAGLRAACSEVLRVVLAGLPDRLVVVAGGQERATWGAGAVGSLAGFGVDVEVSVPGAAPSGDAVLPLAATIGCWLLRQAASDEQLPPVVVEVLPWGATPVEAVRVGGELAASAERVGLIVMGDGSAALSTKAPGYLVAGAEQWQQRTTEALSAVDLAELVGLTEADAARYAAAGRVPWQVLAGAAEGAGDEWRATVHADEAPYGVAYLAVSWRQGSPA